MCVGMCIWTWVSVEDRDIKLELHAIISHMIRVLGANLRSSGSIICALKHWDISLALVWVFYWVIETAGFQNYCWVESCVLIAVILLTFCCCSWWWCFLKPLLISFPGIIYLSPVSSCVHLFSLVQSVPYNILCTACLMVINSFNLFSPSDLRDSFSGYNSVCVGNCGLSEHELHLSMPFWLQMFLLNNQLLFWWSYLHKWLDGSLL